MKYDVVDGYGKLMELVVQDHANEVFKVSNEFQNR